MGLIFLSAYFTVLMAFSFVSHPVSYCILLLLSAFSVSGFSCYVFGFSWYILLFLLVYVGGVYVLFVFVSVHNPNPVSGPSGGGGVYLGIFCACFFSLSFLNWDCLVFGETSHYLCTYFEGFTYCLFCLILMVGFMSISIVVGGKDSFFR
uniref:NADH dehydrogenase subunit 6 n=1 Tax=Creptotrematina aguirrepequenoi TaxID=985756 RepID=UPI003002F85B|nr:NADH dehydrogenase subunit 6 [Creptotrematina aguirrepequenoi]